MDHWRKNEYYMIMGFKLKKSPGKKEPKVPTSFGKKKIVHGTESR